MNFNVLIEDFIRYLISLIYTIICFYTYFVFVALYCIEQEVFEPIFVIINFIFFEIIFGFTMAFYLKVNSNDYASTLNLFPRNLDDENITTNSNDINPFFAKEIKENTSNKRMICRVCNRYKPKRAHHCSKCNKCFLKYDHHCDIFNTCIEFKKYKFFICFLVINEIFLIYTIVILSIILDFKNTKTFSSVLYTIDIVVLGISLFYNTSFLIYHMLLISRNETTVENSAINSFLIGDNSYIHVFQEGPIIEGTRCRDRRLLNPYNVGTVKNFLEVFGDDPSQWISPLSSSKGNGITFPTNMK